MEKNLIAVVPILYGNKQYQPGEILPTSDVSYISAWIDEGTAVWKEVAPVQPAQEEKVKRKAVKAKSMTAQTGSIGNAYPATGAETDLVGKVPSAKARGVVKEKPKRIAKPKI